VILAFHQAESNSSEYSTIGPRLAAAHGSSTLREDVNPAGAEENWQAVLKFLAQFKTP